MHVIRDRAAVTDRVSAWRRAGLSVGFVPTLGGLHDGHRALLRRARSECERVVASVYLNPTQFDSPRDLEAYPADEEQDVGTCREAGVDLLWLGRRDDLLPPGFQTRVEVEELTRSLCGGARPGHFRGVTTVVTQLLHVARPHRAYFGLKDYQQARVVARMVSDLTFDCEIRLVETVREPNGLALSSRNRRLDAEGRRAAAAIHRSLSVARRAVVDGETRAGVVEERLRQALAEEPALEVEYAEVVDAGSLAPLPDGDLLAAADGVLLAVAAYVQGVRLIDNEWIR